jgi:flagellar protein FlaF
VNVIEKAHHAYTQNQVAVCTDRAMEAQLIGRITSRLRAAHAPGRGNYPKLIAAIHENRRMWTTMAAEVADGENALPKELRAQIFYLAEFTEHHSQKVMRGLADVTALIDVNTAVLRGLNGQGT